MRRAHESSSQLCVQPAPDFTINTLITLPGDVMPNIWLRLPEEAKAALPCTAKRFYFDKDLKISQKSERRITLASRPNFVARDRHIESINSGELSKALKNEKCSGTDLAQNPVLMMNPPISTPWKQNLCDLFLSIFESWTKI
ncbi:hypothetical protein [Noviherbaspirillum pedocola]|uniref:Uncharacterized protein n=1 Tax=Noviherbaspirillum pedocola TaxID=2801341 RepID=A0A934SND3_9BURK|nr:hypothetical protein [Noviherbaspirillum pedocola]MBK4733635.1 hypothetical protein [Noviherbaspirillum pedocola]